MRGLLGPDTFQGISMKTILPVCSARPNFMKIAPVMAVTERYLGVREPAKARMAVTA